MAVAALLCAGPARAETDAALATRILAATVRITAYCGGDGQRVATGFAWGSPKQIVTDMHEVIGCDHFDLRYNTPAGARLVQGAHVLRVLVDADLALLQVDDAPSVEPLTASTRALAPSEVVTAWGYPLGIIAPLDTELRTSFTNELYPELKTTLDESARDDLARLKFPSLEAHVLHLVGPLQPGDSGAPIVDSSGQIVGIASGGLRQGAASIAWAMRSEYLPKLSNSTDKPPVPGGAGSLFAYETVHESAARIEAPPTVKCGDLMLTHAGQRPLAELLATTENRQRLPALGKLLGIELGSIGGEVFEIWTELTSGAVAVLPPRASLIAKDGFCTLGGLDPSIDMIVRTHALPRATDTPEWEVENQQERWRGALQNSRFARSELSELPRIQGWSEQRIANGALVLRHAATGSPGGHPEVLVYKADLAGRGASLGISVIDRRHTDHPIGSSSADWARAVLAAALASFPAPDASAAPRPPMDDGDAPDATAAQVKAGPKPYPGIRCGDDRLVRLSRVYRMTELTASAADPLAFGRDLLAAAGVKPDAIADNQFDAWAHPHSGATLLVPRGAFPAQVPTMATAEGAPGCAFTSPERAGRTWLVHLFHTWDFDTAATKFRAMVQNTLGGTLGETRLDATAKPANFRNFARWQIDGMDIAGKPVRVFVAGMLREQYATFIAVSLPMEPGTAAQEAASDLAPVLLAPVPSP